MSYLRCTMVATVSYFLLGCQEGEHFNYKPNYPSVMDYLWQFEYGPHGLFPGYAGSWRLQYSYGNLDFLDEDDLNEAAGIAGRGINLEIDTNHQLISENGPVDWNQDGDTLDIVLRDVNNQKVASSNKLHDHDDWAYLRFYMWESDGFADGSHGDTAEEITEAEAEALGQSVRSDYGMATKPSANHSIEVSSLSLLQKSQASIMLAMHPITINVAPSQSDGSSTSMM